MEKEAFPSPLCMFFREDKLTVQVFYFSSLHLQKVRQQNFYTKSMPDV